MPTIAAFQRPSPALGLVGVAISAAVLAIPASAQHPQVSVSSALARPTAHSIVDWGLGIVEAYGRSLDPEPEPGVAAAFEARRKAIDHLGEAARLLCLLEDVTVGQAMDDNPDFAREVERRVERAEIVDEWLDDECSWTAVARLPLHGGPNGLGTLARPKHADQPFA